MMHTWSIAVAAQRVWDGLAVVERVTRPPRLGHDDRPVKEFCDTGNCFYELDGAEQLADAEAEIDAWEPDEVPNPYEPSLTDSELIGLRGLLQERYDPNYWSRKALDDLRGSLWCNAHQSVAYDCPEDCATRLSRLAASKPSPAVSAAMGTSGEAVSDPPSPASPCSDPSRDRFPRETVGSRGEGGAPDSGIHTSPGAPQPGQLSVHRVPPGCAFCPNWPGGECDVQCEAKQQLDWAGWAIPAILECLAAHFPHYDDDAAMYDCVEDGCAHESFGDTHAWREHLAPLIASRLACDPARAIAALHNHKPQK